MSAAQESKLGEIDFSTFIISLGSSAALQLEPGHPEFDLALAQNTIDILAMLQVKTTGNLTNEESSLLRDILMQTRVAWADAKKASAAKG
jgi:hypothetical protein